MNEPRDNDYAHIQTTLNQDSHKGKYDESDSTAF